MGSELKYSVRSSDLANWCGVPMQGADTKVDTIRPISSAVESGLSFAVKHPAISLPNNMVLIGPSYLKEFTTCLLETNHPRLIFAKALLEIDRRVGFKKVQIESIIDPTAQISPQAFIGNGVQIGKNSIIMPFAYIGDETVIGNDCVIKSGAIIGQDGFGFERNEDGLPIRMLHLGRVIIGNRVEIGALTTVCRGTLGNTVIGDDVKTDDHVHIAHNVNIGTGALITACAEISGGVIIGNNVWIGPNSSLIQKISVGNNSTVGIGSNVVKSVGESTTVAGNPARIFKTCKS